MSFMMQCSPNQLIRRLNQTSSGMNSNNAVLDRDTGKSIVIHYPSSERIFDQFISDKKDGESLYADKLAQLLKCLFIIASLPEDALEEAVEELEGISRFHVNRFPSNDLPVIASSTIKGKLGTAKVRPPIVLEI